MPTFRCDGDIVADAVDTLVVAGWTGRDAAGVAHHIRELAALGVAPPSTVPLFYRVSAALLANVGRIEVVGAATSGEAEPMIVQRGARRWLGLASDHTDRALEAHSVALSKQACAKPCATELWAFDEIAGRLDELELRSWIPTEPGGTGPGGGSDDGSGGGSGGGPEGGSGNGSSTAPRDRARTARGSGDDDGPWTLYQEGTLAALRPLVELLEASPIARRDSAHEDTGTEVMLCGTLPAIGGVRPAGRFRLELRDPASGRTLRHEYAVDSLPEIA